MEEAVRIIRVLLVLLFLSPLAINAWAQATATIVGTVSDASGKALPNANLTIIQKETGLTRRATTNERGGFVVPALPSGAYSVTAEAPGFKRKEVTGIVLQVNQEARVDLELEGGAPKLWGGRFTGRADEQFARFNASFRFDRRLLAADLRACAVHARALGRAGVLSEDETARITGGLQRLGELAAEPGYLDRVEFAASEDVHSFIEARLVELIGAPGYKLHTGRSRNDQVAVATRLFLREEIKALDELLRDAQRALIELAERYADDPLPGYTHLQKAQPVLFAHFLLAYFQMLQRDRERLTEVNQRVNVLPLGAGALAGTNYAVDREWMARELGFASVTRNSLDAVSDRDYLIEFAGAAAVTMMHLSRLAEDLIIYATQEFGFIKLGDAIATGSSLMPQKKNPDSLELVRGKAARVIGHLTALLTLSKGLPLAYNKDLQEDKEALFDVLDTLAGSLRVTATVLRNIEFHRERARAAAGSDYTNATELADYLVRRGLEFRKAHELAGRIVVYALARGKELGQLTLAEYRQFSPLCDEDLFAALALESALAGKQQIGGTAPEQVRQELLRAKTMLSEAAR
jgi:argininosuccinate lyase